MNSEPTRSSRSALAVVRVKRAHGQAMVLFVTLLGVLCLGAILLFNTGQVVNKKVRLTNAVDAAAYSVAVQQARTLNFAAYMNRGRVANEVAIAQMVSLFSWINNLHMHTGIFEFELSILQNIPIIGPVFAALRAGYLVAKQMLSAVRTPALMPGIEAAIVAIDTMDEVYATAATNMIRYGTAAESAVIADDVLKRNDPDADWVPAGRNHLIWKQFPEARDDYISTYRLPERGRDAGMDRYRNVVMESRDYFSRDRGSELPIGPDIKFRVPAYPGTGLDIQISNKLVTQGGTDMVDYDRWTALDTIAPNIGVKVTGYVGVCTWTPWGEECVQVKKTFAEGKFDKPFGYGGAQAVEQAKGQRFRAGINNNAGWASFYDGKHYQPYNGVDGITGWAAEQQPAVDNPVWGDSAAQNDHQYLTKYKGLRDYDDIAPGKATTPDDGPIFTIYAQSGQQRVRTSDVAGIGGQTGSTTRLEGDAKEGLYTAVASAQVYFARPVNLAPFQRVFRGGMRGRESEEGNLFSPYWQARLIDTPNESYSALGIDRL